MCHAHELLLLLSFSAFVSARVWGYVCLSVGVHAKGDGRQAARPASRDESRGRREGEAGAEEGKKGGEEGGSERRVGD